MHSHVHLLLVLYCNIPWLCMHLDRSIDEKNVKVWRSVRIPLLSHTFRRKVAHFWGARDGTNACPARSRAVQDHRYQNGHFQSCMALFDDFPPCSFGSFWEACLESVRRAPSFSHSRHSVACDECIVVYEREARVALQKHLRAAEAWGTKSISSLLPGGVRARVVGELPPFWDSKWEQMQLWKQWLGRCWCRKALHLLLLLSSFQKATTGELCSEVASFGK